LVDAKRIDPKHMVKTSKLAERTEHANGSVTLEEVHRLSRS
jgi:hypothetical protein